jgi:hypothetical protein
MRKFILTFCATLLSIGAATAAVKPEAGKYYLIESARPNGHGHFLSDTVVDVVARQHGEGYVAIRASVNVKSNHFN